MNANSSPKRPIKSPGKPPAKQHYFIGGTAGAGKTTVLEALANRGYQAFDFDFVPSVPRWLNETTGEFWEQLPAALESEKHVTWHWGWYAPALKKSLREAPATHNFWGGSARNQHDFYPIFTKLFVLQLDAETLRQRILTRSSSPYGKDPVELEKILGRHASTTQQLLDVGAIPIDATQDLDAIIEVILKETS